jgi:hypothetical protein
VSKAEPRRTLSWLLQRSERSGPGTLSLGAVSKSVLPAIWLFLAGFLPHQDVYANPDFGLSLLAALGTVGCVGYLLAFFSRHYQVPFGSTTLLVGLSSAKVVSPGNPGAGENWPLLVALLFGPFLVLFSGLGGWVEARGLSRGSRRATQTFPV